MDFVLIDLLSVTEGLCTLRCVACDCMVCALLAVLIETVWCVPS